MYPLAVAVALDVYVVAGIVIMSRRETHKYG